MRIAADSIEVDVTVLVRDELDEATVTRYKEVLDRLPPITVMDLPEDRRVLTDGWHRLTAALELGRSDVEAEVHTGSLADAMVAGATANAHHGRPMTPNERKEAVRRLLRLGWSLSDVASAVAVSAAYVRDIEATVKLRKEYGDAAELSDRAAEAIARAPDNYRGELVRAARDRGWTSDQARDAVAVVKSDIPQRRKDDVLSGGSDPTAMRYMALRDEPRVDRSTIDEATRRLDADAAYQAIVAHREWHSLTLAFWQFRNDQDWATMVRNMNVRDLSQLIADINDIRTFVDDLESRARTHLDTKVKATDG